ncbi:P1 family peptidase [Pendulispora brunnea]|uniref:P1 family peptidase n=1 Tax=Pendulispora brunnea TaxID=2905690 RepID=A0ABZ2K7F0_9BACT
MKLSHIVLAASIVSCTPPKTPPAPASAPVSVEQGSEQRARLRDLGITLGSLPTGKYNAITDVPGVRVGHVTHNWGFGKLIPGKGPARTGVTVILPTSDDFWHSKVPAASFILNGNGEMTGLHYVKEFGYLETPIVFTDTHGIGAAFDGGVRYMQQRFDGIGKDEAPTTPLVGECDDGWLNDMRGLHVTAADVMKAAERASDGPVQEGAVGGGTGMMCYGFKCGIGTSSRVLPDKAGGYIVGAIVQSNFGTRPELRINGVPVGEEIKDLLPEEAYHTDGSLLVVVATNAPLTSRQLERVTRRVSLGVARTGTISHNGSGDLFVAFATGNRIPGQPTELTHPLRELADERIDPIFQATVESVEEAILNSLTMATTTRGRDDHVAHAIPLDRLRAIMRRYGR